MKDRMTPEELIQLTQMALPKEIFEISNRIHYSKWQAAEKRAERAEARIAAIESELKAAKIATAMYAGGFDKALTADREAGAALTVALAEGLEACTKAILTYNPDNGMDVTPNQLNAWRAIAVAVCAGGGAEAGLAAMKRQAKRAALEGRLELLEDVNRAVAEAARKAANEARSFSVWMEHDIEIAKKALAALAQAEKGR